jgi:hypothetical protein
VLPANCKRSSPGGEIFPGSELCPVSLRAGAGLRKIFSEERESCWKCHHSASDLGESHLGCEVKFFLLSFLSRISRTISVFVSFHCFLLLTFRSDLVAPNYGAPDRAFEPSRTRACGDSTRFGGGFGRHGQGPVLGKTPSTSRRS